MAEAGCHMLFYGIEASDTTTLRLRRKSFAKGFEKIASDIHHAQSCGIFVRGGFIVGHETDTEETFVRHLEFLKEVRPDELYLSFLTPFPGTPLYAKAEKQGLLLERDWRKYDCEHPVMKVRIPAPELVRLRRDLYQQYYNSSEWNSHLDSRIARREQERDTIGIYRNFIDGRLKLMKNNLFFNGS
jgi:radical SAM superfamily enzyme YgiQ (UPF0313 family)